jgi:thymidylate kinase
VVVVIIDKNMTEKKGKLIVFYGTNNLGKSTQAKILIKKLKEKEIKAEYIKYPLYDLKPSGPTLNDYLRNSNPYNLTAREAQLVYCLNRTQYQETIKEKLEKGINIIAEDYTGTGIAWGLGAGVDQDFLEKINSHLIKEDIAILFDGERFKDAIEKDHKHEKDEEFSRKVRQIHLDLGVKYNWYKINANLTIEEISDIIFEKIILSL